MSRGDYLLVSVTSPADVNICRLLGAYKRVEDHLGRPAYVQLHDGPGSALTVLLYATTGNWSLGAIPKGYSSGPSFTFINTSKSTAVPTSGWQYDDAAGGAYLPAPGLTMTLLTDPSTVLCSDVTIRLGPGPDNLGTFSPIPGSFRFGRQTFCNEARSKWLAVDARGCWFADWGDRSHVVGVASGSAPAMCPADPGAKVNADRGDKNWRYADKKEKKWQESSDIIVTCASHAGDNTASGLATAPEQNSQNQDHRNIDDLVGFIEGSTEGSESNASKKRKRKKNAFKPLTENNNNPYVTKNGSNEQNKDSKLQALGAVGGVVNDKKVKEF